MVRSTFFGFTTALRGMSASQRALDVSGQNIGNVNTSGYTRQRVDLYSAISGGSRERYASQFSNAVGNGVVIGGISQIRDPFLDVRFRNEANKLGEVDARISALKDLANIFDETMTEGVTAQVNDAIKQLQTLTKNTGSAEFDGIVKASMDVMTKLFNQYAIQTGKIRDQQDYQLEKVTVPAVNDILKSIAALNQSIKEDQAHGNPALELKDQRNVLLDELSSYMNISVTETNVKEISPGLVLSDLKIELLDNENRPLLTLLEGENASELTYGKDSSGKTVIGLTPGSPNVSYTPTVDTMNDLLGGINDINNKIRDLTLATPPTADQKTKLQALKDKQATYTEQLKNFIPSATVTNSTIGEKTYTSIKLGSADVIAANGTTSTLTKFVSTGNAVTLNGAAVTSSIGGVDITDQFTSGIMKGALDILNKSGEFDKPPNTSRGVGYYEKILDTIASRLADEFNTMNSLHDPLNATINPDFDTTKEESTTNLKYFAKDPTFAPAPGALYPPGNEWKPLFADRYGNTPITAKGLSIAQGWVDSKYGVTATKLPLAPGGDNSGQSENILEMIAFFDKKFQFTTDGKPDGTKLFLGSFHEVFGQTNSVLNLDLNSTNKIFKNHMTLLNGVDDQRSGLSSVSLDEEAVNLLKYQKSYNAAARLMTTLDEAISTIIHNMGRVGV